MMATRFPPSLERFNVSRKRRTALIFCFYAIPNAKPLSTFAGIALKTTDKETENQETSRTPLP
ncbi:hypothetical protein EHI45_14640 [Rhizobium leguminosarum]|nr:hypothetical protein EHI45_14640 [Rhizobium leguminosarum]